MIVKKMMDVAVPIYVGTVLSLYIWLTTTEWFQLSPNNRVVFGTGAILYVVLFPTFVILYMRVLKRESRRERELCTKLQN